MAKKQDSYYFQNFIECAEYSCKAANLLKKTMEQFDVNALPARMEEIHQVEHEADVKKHELLNVLVKAFITPIEREDIMQVSQNLDDLTDKIEDVLIKIYYNGISGMRADSLKLAEVIIQCCDEVRKLMNEFADFKKSKSSTSTSSASTAWRKRRTSCSSTACTTCTTPARTRSRSLRGARSTSTWKSARTPASMWRIRWRAP